MEVDAQTFAFWGVDQVKLDGCYVDVAQMDQGFYSFSFLNSLANLLNEAIKRLSRVWWVFERYGKTNGLLVQLARLSRKCT